MDKAVNEGAFFISSCGMDDEVGLFVNDKNLLVFVNNIQRDIFGNDFLNFWWRQDYVNNVAGVEFVALFGGGVIDADTLLLD